MSVPVREWFAMPRLTSGSVYSSEAWKVVEYHHISIVFLQHVRRVVLFGMQPLLPRAFPSQKINQRIEESITHICTISEKYSLILYGEQLMFFIELIYPSFKRDIAWNTAVNNCRDINKNMKVVNFGLIFKQRKWDTSTVYRPHGCISSLGTTLIN